MARRVGSARAAKVEVRESGCTVFILLVIYRNWGVVSRVSLQDFSVLGCKALGELWATKEGMPRFRQVWLDFGRAGSNVVAFGPA